VTAHPDVAIRLAQLGYIRRAQATPAAARIWTAMSMLLTRAGTVFPTSSTWSPAMLDEDERYVYAVTL